ncbi:multidrug efflux SMR transporter [Streptomyces sp. NA04227]|uniref:DMT family transporter n=1 Tax=Streptomyces sp. NA04227 TaxID=2742136 RepID=UPI0015926F36|nr:multidrug efflux SMR transporter [Streptomyces sp. NA04227]QKW08503.1 multidrug efflux SMR transporter [Streptomyces sp. NA04227]
MTWVILFLSSVFEAVWATALGRSDGLHEPVPTCVFLVGVVLSMAGLGYAMKRIQLSVAYAVWIGGGAAMTVLYGVLTGHESASPLKGVFLAGIVACVVGLKFVKGSENGEDGRGGEDGEDEGSGEGSGKGTDDHRCPARNP